jgi:non-ribosomal peptide synthetase component F
MNRSLGQDALIVTTTEDLTQKRSTIVDLFQAQVISSALSTALEVNDESLSYANLGSRVDRVARDLRSHGIGCGDIVALCLKRTENLVIAMLGVLKTGAAYLPLNPSDPPYRLGQVISHAASRFVVTDSQSMKNLPEVSSHVWVMDRRPAMATEVDGGDALNAPEATDVAYVIYTSGTTGSPKGVAVTHGALANIFSDVAQRVALNDRTSWLALTTVCFDIAALELLSPLCFGGKVILVSEEQARIGRVLAGIIFHKKPTVMQATPITWRILVESGWAGSPELTILCGGDRQGKLEFHGRIDHQVKINGFRIEVQEIESAIRRLPGITDVAVAGVLGPSNQKRLYAFFVAEPNLKITLSDLVSHLARYLPKYMIPEKFWALENLPSTPNGKRDTTALQLLARVKPELAG